MFEVRCIVGDKKLSDVLRVLKGHTIEHPVVIPVDEAGTVADTPATNGIVKPKKKYRKPIQRGGKHLKGAGSTQIIRNLITKSGATHITAREMKQATVAAGYSKGAYSNAVKVLMADKTLRQLGAGEYEVIRPTQAHPTPAHEAIQHG